MEKSNEMEEESSLDLGHYQRLYSCLLANLSELEQYLTFIHVWLGRLVHS